MAQITIMLIPLTEWAEQNTVNMATARKYAQNGRLIGAQKLEGRWVVPITAKVPARGESGNPNFKRRVTGFITVDDDPQDEHRDAY